MSDKTKRNTAEPGQGAMRTIGDECVLTRAAPPPGAVLRWLQSPLPGRTILVASGGSR